MKKYIKKPENTTLAIQWDGSETVRKSIEKEFSINVTEFPNIKIGDWVAEEHKNAVSAMSNEQFQKEYEEYQDTGLRNPESGIAHIGLSWEDNELISQLCAQTKSDIRNNIGTDKK